jgi:acetylornithine deacetylase/succinyl-diaminopimelate desuccinylase-like protein
MVDLIKVLSSLVDSHGRILVEGIMDDVKPVTAEEEALYDSIDFRLDEYAAENKISSGKLIQDDKKSLLMARWRFPTLSLHGIQGAFSGIGAKTVIPAKVIGKFSLRLVPDQDAKKIEALIQKHVTKQMQLVSNLSRSCMFVVFPLTLWPLDWLA